MTKTALAPIAHHLQTDSITTDLPIENLEIILSEMECSLDAVRYIRNTLVEPTELDRDQLNAMAPLIGLYLVHAQNLIKAGRRMLEAGAIKAPRE